MKNIQVTTSKTIDGETHKVTTELFVGETLEDLVETYSSEFVHDLAIRQLKVAQQQQVRSDIEKYVAEGEDTATIAPKYENWNAQENQRVRKTPAQKFQELLSKMAPEEVEQLKATLLA